MNFNVSANGNEFDAPTPTVVWQSVVTKDIFTKDLPNREFDNARDIRSSVFGRPIVFCSLQNAKIIRRTEMPVHVGLFYPEKFLHYTEYSSYVNSKYLLNSDYIVLPWHAIPEKLDFIISLYGENIFIRPNSPDKIFTGFSKVGKESILFELNALSQTNRVNRSELCIIAPGKTLPVIEWRFWAVDGRVSTYAPYGWDNGKLIDVSVTDLPTPIIAAVTDIANGLIEHENALVIDMVMMSDQPTLVEINAISTSGWYQGIDYKKLIDDLANLY